MLSKRQKSFDRSVAVVLNEQNLFISGFGLLSDLIALALRLVRGSLIYFLISTVIVSKLEDSHDLHNNVIAY